MDLESLPNGLDMHSRVGEMSDMNGSTRVGGIGAMNRKADLELWTLGGG